MNVLKYVGLGLIFSMCILPFGWAEEQGISDWGVNDSTYGLKTREVVAGATVGYTPSPADWRDINIYQLFTDRFASSGVDHLTGKRVGWKSDGISYPSNRNYHHGGDWKGLKDNLDYLSGLGVKAVWISGVQENDQGKDTRYTPYHMYHPENFFKVDPAMGTFQDLKDLIDECHRRGIYVILDVVVNHMCDKNGINTGNANDDAQYWPNGHSSFNWWNSSNKHPAPFDTLNYFHNNGTINNWDTSPENLLGQFKGTDDLKTENSEVQSILLRAFKNLIDATDCDGFRVDAIKHVEFDWIMQWATDIRNHAKYRGKNDFIIFGELFSYNTQALAAYCKEDNKGFNSALFFPLSQTIKGVFGDGNWTGYLGQTMQDVSQFGEGANRLVAFVDNHDLNRIALQIAGTDVSQAVWKMKPALSFLYLATPVPLLYYGTEHAFNQGGHYNGSSKTADNPDDGDWQRENMFDKGFQPGPASGNKLTATNAPLYGHVAWLNKIREQSIALRRGTFAQRLYSGGQGQYAFTKTYGDQVALVILNTSDSAITLASWPAVGQANTAFYENGDTSTTPLRSDANGNLNTSSLSIEGKGTKIFISNPSGGNSLWTSGTYSWPAQGDATSLDTIYINTEAGPATDVTGVEVLWNIGSQAGTNSMAVNTAWISDSGKWYNAALGPFPAGTLQYVIRVKGSGTNEYLDNNGGSKYSLTITSATDFSLLGTVSKPTVPTSEDEVIVSTILAGNADDVSVSIGYTMDGGNTWTVSAMTLDTVQDDSRGVRYVHHFGQLAAGTQITYFLVAEDVDGVTYYDNNGGSDYRIVLRQDLSDLRMMPNSPDMTSGTFDMDDTGGALQTIAADGADGGFGDFGSVYVNYDEEYIYIGGTGMSMPTDVDNNVPVIFVSAGTNAGAENFWYCNSLPNALDRLHNVGFDRPIQAAILLGDIYGNGSHTNFNIYHDDTTGQGPDVGQGPFATPANGAGNEQAFSGVPDAKMLQFDGYGFQDGQTPPVKRQAASWKCAIPLSFLGAGSAEELGTVYVSGLLLSYDQNNEDNNTYLSGKYLGVSCELPVADEPLDEYQNIGRSYVYLTGAPFSIGQASSLGVPEEWLTTHGITNFSATSDQDGDGISDRAEYFAGLDPNVRDELVIELADGQHMQLYKVGNHSCSYVVQYADTLNLETKEWNWRDTPPVASTNGYVALPAMMETTNGILLVRATVVVPPVGQTSDRISLSAAPAGGNFSAETINVTLYVSGVNVASSTYLVQGGTATSYTNNQVISFGSGMTIGESRTLTLAGSTSGGVIGQQVYTFTKIDSTVLSLAWVGNVSLATNTDRTVSVRMETSPIGAAVSAGLVYNTSSAEGNWPTAVLNKSTSTSSNDVWIAAIGPFDTGATIQVAANASGTTGDAIWVNNDGNNYRITIPSESSGGNMPYSTNPTKGKYRAAGITIDGENTGGEWTDDMLIALDMANDDPRSLGDNWTMHEAPLDFTHLWACWDDNNVYLAWQMVDVTDVLDPANAGGGNPINQTGGILMWIVLDTKAGGCTGDMWNKQNTWSGPNTPNYQIYMAGNLWQSYMSTALTGNKWAGDAEMGTTYNTGAGWGLSIAKSASLVATSVWGVNDCDDRNDSSKLRNFLPAHTRTDRDSFYEIKIPMTAIGITKAQLESTGIAVMLGAGVLSTIDTIPNSSATTDTPGVTDSNSSWEWEDNDIFTEPFARIGI